jgi:hypothetical protein
VPAGLIERAAGPYGPGPSLLWLGQGLQRQPTGGNVMRACALLPAATGNLGKPDAGFLNLNWFNARGIDEAYRSAAHLSRGVPPISRHMDLADCLADPARSSALVCWNMNVAASGPRQQQLRLALRREDLFTVVVDLFQTDTADFAGVVLPAASFLEFDDLFVPYFQLLLSAQVKAAEPLGEALPNPEIFRRLARAMGYTEPELYEPDAEVIATVLRASGQVEDLAALADTGSVPVSAEPRVQFADLRFPSPGGRVEFASAQVVSAPGFPDSPRRRRRRPPRHARAGWCIVPAPPVTPRGGAGAAPVRKEGGHGPRIAGTPHRRPRVRPRAARRLARLTPPGAGRPPRPGGQGVCCARRAPAWRRRLRGGGGRRGAHGHGHRHQQRSAGRQHQRSEDDGRFAPGAAGGVDDVVLVPDGVTRLQDDVGVGLGQVLDRPGRPGCRPPQDVGRPLRERPAELPGRHAEQRGAGVAVGEDRLAGLEDEAGQVERLARRPVGGGAGEDRGGDAGGQLLGGDAGRRGGLLGEGADPASGQDEAGEAGETGAAGAEPGQRATAGGTDALRVQGVRGGAPFVARTPSAVPHGDRARRRAGRDQRGTDPPVAHRWACPYWRGEPPSLAGHAEPIRLADRVRARTPGFARTAVAGWATVRGEG